MALQVYNWNFKLIFSPLTIHTQTFTKLSVFDFIYGKKILGCVGHLYNLYRTTFYLFSIPLAYQLFDKLRYPFHFVHNVVGDLLLRLEYKLNIFNYCNWLRWIEDLPNAFALKIIIGKIWNWRCNSLDIHFWMKTKFGK